jgi:phytoene dehydrogenase-like protein
MISTLCELGPWEGLSDPAYADRTREAGERLVGLARRVDPDLGRGALVREVATPRTYGRFTGRPRGAVGGTRQSVSNANQNAVPHDVGVPGLWLVGGRNIAEAVLRRSGGPFGARRPAPRSPIFAAAARR